MPNSEPIDYRSVQAPSVVDTSLPDNGAAARAEALSNAFREFSGVSQNVSNQFQARAGAIAGAASGDTGHPDYKTGLLSLTSYARAFNNAATGAYAIQAEASAENDAARLRVQANNDPNTFYATYTAARDAVVKNAPPMAQGMLMELYNRHLASGMAQISGDQAAEIQQTHKQEYDAGVQRAISRVAQLQGSDNVEDNLRGDDEHAKMTLLIQGGVNSGLYSPAEAQAMQIAAAKKITAQVFETKLDTELGKMQSSSIVNNGIADSGDVVRLIEKFRQMHEDNLKDTDQPPVLSEDEYNALMMNAKQKLLQEQMLESSTRRTQDEQKLLQFENGDRTITVAMGNMAQGTLRPTDLINMVTDMVHTADLRPEVGRAVLAAVQRGGDAPPSKQGLFYLENDPAVFDWKPQDYANAVNRADINWPQAMELQKYVESKRQGFENHIPVKNAIRSLDSLLLPKGITFETASDEQKMAHTNARVEVLRQLGAMNPAEVDSKAQQVANNVASEYQAKALDAKAQAYTSQLTFIDKTFGPGGPSFKNKADYDARKAHFQDLAKQAQDQAAQLRKGIKQ